MKFQKIKKNSSKKMKKIRNKIINKNKNNWQNYKKNIKFFRVNFSKARRHSE